MKKKLDNKIIWISVIVFAVSMYLMSGTTQTKQVDIVEGSWDISEQAKAANLDIYLVEEPDFDFSSDNIQAVAKNLKSKSSTPEDAIRNTIRFTANNVRYSSEITVSYCYSEKASDVLRTQKGDCVSMSRLNTALFRAMGIPARTRGGCLSQSLRCSPMFSAVPGLEPQSVEMMEGDFKKRGFLHEYVEVWTPSEGWILIESTSGQKFDTECNMYLHYSYDTNNRERCVINDRSFWDECRGY